MRKKRKVPKCVLNVGVKFTVSLQHWKFLLQLVIENQLGQKLNNGLGWKVP